jgi:hypothetical protein
MTPMHGGVVEEYMAFQKGPKVQATITIIPPKYIE